VGADHQEGGRLCGLIPAESIFPKRPAMPGVFHFDFAVMRAQETLIRSHIPLD
jgi:hypothetical protein